MFWAALFYFVLPLGYSSLPSRTFICCCVTLQVSCLLDSSLPPAVRKRLVGGADLAAPGCQVCTSHILTPEWQRATSINKGSIIIQQCRVVVERRRMEVTPRSSNRRHVYKSLTS